MSPTVFRERGYRFFFFSREESRPHVHVYSGDGEAKFWLQPEVSLARNYKFSAPNRSRKYRPSSKTDAMSSRPLGTNTSDVEVTNVSPHGFWLLVEGRELYLPFEQFPWFRDASIAAISRIEKPRRNHFYWPELDVDLTLEMIESAEKYPEVSKVKDK